MNETQLAQEVESALRLKFDTQVYVDYSPVREALQTNMFYRVNGKRFRITLDIPVDTTVDYDPAAYISEAENVLGEEIAILRYKQESQ